MKAASRQWPAIGQDALRKIDEDAIKLCQGDMALWEHHRALLEGELRAQTKGKEFFECARNLPQYRAAAASVVEAWRKLLKNIEGVPEERQTDAYAINRAIILGSCRRARNEGDVARMLKERAQSIEVFAENGDVEFFRSLGRLLSAPPRSSLEAYHYAHCVLSHWLTSYLWLMPERIAADHLAAWFGETPVSTKDSDKALRHFKKTKAQYELKAHWPNLIDEIQPDGKLILTAEGKRLFRSLTPPK